MVRKKAASFIGAIALLAAAAPTAAGAADMPLPPVAVPPIDDYAASGWYLRGDIGMTNQYLKGLHQSFYDQPGTSVESVGLGWDSSMLFGLGVGYRFNDWVRFDVTGEYRGKSNFHGSDNVRFTGGSGVHNYFGSKSEWVVMTNAYVDLGTWYSVTPYLGAGVGAANIRISGFRDDGFIPSGPTNSTTYAEDADKWNFAWALHAGVTYRVTQSMSVDFGYRYLNLGNATTGATRAFDGSFVNGGPFTFNNVYSHDLKLGIRWMLEPPISPQPIMLPPLQSRS
jgi:opacity protein-like surface antigen